MGGRSKAQTMGYRYYMGILMGFARGPLDEMVEIKAGDRTAWKGSVMSNQTIQIQAGELFGGIRPRVASPGHWTSCSAPRGSR
ncbi:hypothetical protein [Pseudomonas aeruginosa]|uniref:hypothetical protein n=1 Tax=Pseudomonas aeruginosa TaxID=287 RepID=UPI00211AC340|nr:hypothetical protein [Pseudomonas aeruginosa]